MKKLNSMQTLVKYIREPSLWSLLSKTCKKSHLITQTPITLNAFLFYPNNCLVTLRILSYRESTVAASISSFARNIYIKFYFLSPDLQYSSFLKSSQVSLPRLPTLNNQWNFCRVVQKATILCALEVIFK